MEKRVRTLLRVSSRQQLHDDDIPIQRAEAAEYIEKRPDWVFDREYIEKAVSAYKNSAGEREVLQEILSDAKEKQFDILLTYMSDRIGRQEEYSFYVAALNRLGIEVWTVKDGQLKTEDHVDKLLNYIRFWQNEGESKKTGMRVRDTRRELAKAGKFAGGKAPFGYWLVPSGAISSHGRLLKKLEIVPEQADIVRMIYEFAVQQGMGYERIAKELNRRKIPAISVGIWKAGTVRCILTNPIYMGFPAVNRRVNRGKTVRTDRREWVYSDCQIKELVIVPQQVWEQAQEIREARKAKIHAAKEQAADLYRECSHVPFSTSGRLALLGLVSCGYCGRRLKNGSYCNRWTTKAGERKAAFHGRYVCPGRCLERSSYSQKELEYVVFEGVERFLEQLSPLDVTEEIKERQRQQKENAEKEQKRTEKKMAALKQDIRTLEEKIPEAIRGDYCFSAEKLSAIIEEKGQMLRELAVKGEENEKKLLQFSHSDGIMRKAASMLPDLHPDWKEEFQKGDTAFKRMLISSLLECIVVRDGEVHIRFRIRPESVMPETTGFGVPKPGL